MAIVVKTVYHYRPFSVRVLFVVLALWLFFDRLDSELFIRGLRDVFALF